MNKIKTIIGRPKTVLVLTFIFFGLMLLTNGSFKIDSDGFASYHIAASLVKQGTVAPSQRPEYYNYRKHVIGQFDGKYVTVYPPGAAFINTPGILIANLFQQQTTGVTTDYFMAANGHTLAEGIAFLVTAMIVGLSSMLLMYQSLIKLKLKPQIAIFSVFCAFASSYALWYIFLLPGYSHVYEMFGLSLMIYGYIDYLQNNKSKFGLVLTGVGLGVAVLCRPIMLVFALLPFLHLIVNKNWRSLLWIMLGGLPFAILLGWYNYVSYGSIVSSGYNAVRGETFTFSQFNGIQVLFSPYRGYLIFTPVFILAISGLTLLCRKYIQLAGSLLLGFILIVILYGFWPSWWGGGSFGARFFVFATPIGSLGLGYLLSQAKDKNWQLYTYKISKRSSLIYLSLVLTTWSIVLTLCMRFTPVANSVVLITNSAGVVQYFEKTSPLFYFNYQLNLIKEASSINNYLGNLKSSVVGNVPLIAIFTDQLKQIIVVEYSGQQINISRIAPPKSGQTFSQQISFYVYKAHQPIYLVTLTNLAKQTSFVLSCKQTCQSQDPYVIINEIIPPVELAREEISHIAKVNNGYQLYFLKAENIEFHGDPVNPQIGTTKFYLD